MSDLIGRYAMHGMFPCRIRAVEHCDYDRWALLVEYPDGTLHAANYLEVVMKTPPPEPLPEPTGLPGDGVPLTQRKKR